MQTGDKGLKFGICFVELFVHCQSFFLFFLFFPSRFLKAVVIEFDGDLEGLNRLTEFGRFSSGEEVDFLLNFSNFVVEFQEGLLRSLVVIQQVLAFVKVLLALLNVELQLVLHRGVARLEEHGVGHLDGVADLLGLLSDMPLFGEG